MTKPKTREDELKKELESKRKLVEYWKNKYAELEAKHKEMEIYQRGFKDATYYCGGAR